MSTVMNSMWGYIDGIGVMVTTYILSPAGSKVKNTLVVGLVHGVLHGTAANNLVSNEKQNTRKLIDQSDDYDEILSKPQGSKPAAPLHIPSIPTRNLVHNQPGSERQPDKPKPIFTTMPVHIPTLSNHNFRSPGLFGLPFGGQRSKNPFIMS